MKVKKLQLAPDIEQCTGSKLGKGYVKVVYCHPVYLYAQYIMWNVGLGDSQAGIKTSGRNINNLKYADDTTLMAESEDRVSWWRWKRGVKKLAWNSAFKKTKIMASGPITSRKTDG